MIDWQYDMIKKYLIWPYLKLDNFNIFTLCQAKIVVATPRDVEGPNSPKRKKRNGDKKENDRVTTEASFHCGPLQ